MFCFLLILIISIPTVSLQVFLVLFWLFQYFNIYISYLAAPKGDLVLIIGPMNMINESDKFLAASTTAIVLARQSEIPRLCRGTDTIDQFTVQTLAENDLSPWKCQMLRPVSILTYFPNVRFQWRSDAFLRWCDGLLPTTQLYLNSMDLCNA